MKISALFVALAYVLSAGSCNGNSGGPQGKSEGAAGGNSKAASEKADLSKLQHATFAGGCFWCEEAIFESIKGVGEVVSGYSGGKTDNPTYEGVGMGTTGHAEAIEVYYDSSVVDFPTLVDVFIASIDPFQANGQGPDHGSQYRSIIFYRNDQEKAVAEQKIGEVNAKSGRKSAVEIVAFAKFWEGEDYHQDYVPNHPENPYVQHESIPRMKRTQKQVMAWVKPDKVAK
jgi:peptide-methionine (S)-S-oxide reductase